MKNSKRPASNRSSPSPQDPLDAYRQRYEEIKPSLLELGFICRGSLGERWATCGKANCKCQDDPSQRHGPYYHLTWKEGGKTVGRYISAEEARLYKEWIANRCTLEEIIQRMYAVSQQAQTHMLPPQKANPRSPKRQSPRSSRTRKAP